MPITRDLPFTVSTDLRISSDRDVALTPIEALQFAERVTLAAMMRQAALMPSRGPRRSSRLHAGHLAATPRKVSAV